MPFVTEEHRKAPDYTIPGDKTFAAYSKIMELWRNNPRWTTVDMIAESIWPKPWERAYILAFLVFFSLIVMPYELGKREANGDI